MESLNKKHYGAVGELLACQWLLNNGYEVFRNVSACGLVDIVALNVETKEILLIDVKLVPHLQCAGHSMSIEQANLGVKLLLITKSGECKFRGSKERGPIKRKGSDGPRKNLYPRFEVSNEPVDEAEFLANFPERFNGTNRASRVSGRAPAPHVHSVGFLKRKRKPKLG